MKRYDNERHYHAIVDRGLITPETDLFDFLEKILKNKKNVRKIIIHKTQTSFYFYKEDEERLLKELKSKAQYRSFKLIWDVNRFVLKTNISKAFKLKLMELFEPKQPKPIKTVNTIRGYYGCPITGYNFGWK